MRVLIIGCGYVGFRSESSWSGKDMPSAASGTRRRARPASKALEQRLASLAGATGVSQQAHWNNPSRFMACSLAEVLKAVVTNIEKFEHQTWIEFAKCSTVECAWARQFVEAKTKAGKTYYTAIQALAYKWIRILHACWKKGVVYDEACCLKSLQQHHSPSGPTTQSKA
jgi:hypothetical protein